MEPVLAGACVGACACVCAGAAGATIKIEIATMQLTVVAAARQRNRLWRGIVPPEKLGCFAPLVLLLRNIYSFRSSRRRLVWARETGISLARLSFILSM
jgi:hypothetical protein